ncbi:CsbD family protein [uncultured Agrococcus sp.]|uniref:CsbD family protein n=1 Tax=uncultured Agrococcus sp. TaxID=382258 RepID=UPI0025FCBF5F|nr:CsbD family protein [uncultured Agrococcus sp.]
MSAEDKASANMDKLKGKAKEATGKVTGDDQKTAEGKVDQAKGDAKQAFEKTKDAAKNVFDNDR